MSSFIQDFDALDKEEDIEQMKRDLLIERAGLVQTLDSSSVGFSLFSEEVIQEVKDLLRLFGVPFVEAPFEAESQCAELERNGLVDGIVTEDSDVFLFGGRSVYKNIFHKSQFVQSYKMTTVAKELGLS